MRIAIPALFVLGVAAVAGAEDVYVGVEVPAGRRVPLDAIDHAPFDALLKRYVDDSGRVDYRGWKGSADSVAALDAYLASLSAGDPSRTTKAAQVAFWVNAYNAVTIRGILREYPTSSIRNHTAAVWGYNIWKDLLLRVGGGAPSLNDIEHQTLRPLGDPRIHFALVCASVGCPKLRNEAYTPQRLEEQLEDNARHFFAQRQNFVADPVARTIGLSSILDWYGEDFGKSDAEILRRIAAWLPDDAARTLASSPGVRVKHLDYDWSLNERR